MRIISKFHDYYDGCLAYGMDPKCVYLRELAEITDDSKWPAELKLKNPLNNPRTARWYDWHDYECGCVWFCGKSYPFIVFPYYSYRIVTVGHSVGDLIRCTEFNYCYTLKQFEEALLANGTKKDISRYTQPSKRRNYSAKEKFRQFFMGNKYPDKTITDTLCKLGIPCLAWAEHPGTRHNNLYLNPELRKFQFFKVKDSFAAFQELSMFISGVMGGQAPPMIPISDEVRLEKHGFDRIWSFRKKAR